MNRIGNLVVPNENYCKFEDWITPILNAMVDEQTSEGTKWTPSKMICRLGKEINDPSVIYYKGLPIRPDTWYKVTHPSMSW